MKEKLKQWSKKKRIKIGVIAIAILLLIVAGGLVIHGKNSKTKAEGATVQSAEAQKGTVSTTVVGTGTLSSAQTTAVKVPVGVKVKKVLVESGDVVTKGQKLATVDEASVAKLLLEVKENIEETEDEIDDLSSDASVSGTTEYLEAKVLNGTLEDLEETEAKLEKLLDKKAITATCDGVIGDVYVSADTEASENSDTGTTNSTGSVISGNLSASAESETSDVINVSVETKESQIMLLSSDSDDNTVVTIKDVSIDLAAPVTGEKPQTELGNSDYFAGTVSWNCTTETFKENTVYTATIKLTAKEGYVFSKNIIPEVKGADVSYEVLESDAGESILKIKAQFAKTGKEEKTEDSSEESQSESNASQNTGGTTAQNSGNNSSGSLGSSSAPKTSGGSVSAQAKASGGGSVSGSISSGSSSSSNSSSSAENPSLTTAFSIASQDQVAVSIQVDELDINTVKEGQSATITMDALEGETFEGTITDVSSVASSSGNSVKYPVEIVMDKTEDMLLGMSASATITVEESEDAIVIPVNALQERGNRTFVYTEKDSEGNLSGETEVETGLSNENQVEILSGLEEGDTVYYLKVGSSSEDTAMPGMKQWDGERGGNGGGPGGDMPSGDMPSGGKPSQKGSNMEGGQ